MKLDIHTHSTFSHDGKSSLQELVKQASEQGLSYYGITEHLNFDYVDILNRMLRYVDVDGYFKCAREMQNEYVNNLNIIVGAEFGYSEEKEVCDKYKEILSKYNPDLVINSVHSYRGVDFCLLYKLLSKQEMCEKYLLTVEKSLDADYHYDIIGHIGYVVRYMPGYTFNEFFEQNKGQITNILNKIIEKDKILEINSSCRDLDVITLPNDKLCSLYYELGGRKISFGSDAHVKERLCDKFDYVVKMAKEIGFTHICVPINKKIIEVAI